MSEKTMVICGATGQQGGAVLRKQFEAWGRPPHPHAMLEALENSRRLLPNLLSFEKYLRERGFGA